MNLLFLNNKWNSTLDTNLSFIEEMLLIALKLYITIYANNC